MFRRSRKAEIDQQAGNGADMLAAAFSALPGIAIVVDAKDTIVDVSRGAASLGARSGGRLADLSSPLVHAAEGAKVSISGRDYTVSSASILEDHRVVSLVPVAAPATVSDAGLRQAAQDAQAKLDTLMKSVEKVSAASAAEGASAASLGGGIDEVTNTFEIVAAAAQELDASISEITRQATQSSTEAEAAVERTEAANVTVRQLAESSERIGEVVGLIEEIAAQTNLLALNATIEAARAGEAGRGFAVVAAEVKNLAQQTTKATGDITQQISTIQSTMRDAVEAIDGINSTIKQISSVSTAIAGAVGQQSSATADISRNVLLAAENMRALSENVAAMAAESSDKPETMRAVVDIAREVGDLNKSIARQSDDVMESIRRAA